MNTREIAAEYRLKQWSKTMQERLASGKSIREYCKEAGMHENVYFYWQRKLREAACSGMLTSGDNEVVVKEKDAPKGWAVCKSKINISEKPLPIEIGGCKVLASADMDDELLLKVCRLLKSL